MCVYIYINKIHPAAMAEKNEKKQHFILVHGACHGAWCWYKLKPLLEAAGHRVTVLDMAASGIDRRPLEEVRTFSDYSKPLLETMDGVIGDGGKVIMVGHSLGGLSLALAMEAHPDKIAAAVFLTAYVPDTVNSPSYVLDMVTIFFTFIHNQNQIHFLPLTSPKILYIFSIKSKIRFTIYKLTQFNG